MTPTDCQSWFPSLSAFIDGELAPARRVQIEHHLATCRDCSARVSDLRATSGMVRIGMEMRADEADFSDFFDKVLAKIEPHRVPLWERWKLTLSELFAYHRGAMISSLATAAIAVLIAVPIALRSRPPTGYASAQLSGSIIAMFSTLRRSRRKPTRTTTKTSTASLSRSKNNR